jgi:hypothetical protein
MLYRHQTGRLILTTSNIIETGEALNSGIGKEHIGKLKRVANPFRLE